MPYHKLMPFIATLFITTISFSQKLDHVLGEVIVEVRNEIELSSLVKDLSGKGIYRSSIQSRQILKEPMNLWVLKIDANLDNELEFLETVTTSKYALLAQQNHITQLRQTIPNDPLFENQWQYINLGQNSGMFGADIDMDLAWDHTTGGTTITGDEIVVCVIDDGVNEAHPDFGDNLWINEAEIPNNGIDDDGNGYVDDVRGWDILTNNDNISLIGGEGAHGTSVAGIVGAQGNNMTGVAGVNWDVKLMIVRGGSPESNAIASYAYPYTMRKMYNDSNGEEGAFVVSTNASWGVNNGQPEDAPIWCDFYNMLGEVGILNFGATANANFNVDETGDLPTACESDFLVSVTNVTRTDDKEGPAGYGLRTIDLGAFGTAAYTINATNYSGFGGTSGATPLVTGTAALLYSTDCMDFMSLVKTNPSQAALVIKDAILHGVDPNQSLAEITTTGGRLNVNNSIKNLLKTCGTCSDAQGFDVESNDGETSLTWFDNGNLGNVSIRYKELDAPNWIEIEGITPGYQFSDLLFCTSYEYQVKTTCPNNNNDYSYARVFSTDGCCVVPEDFEATIDGETATITWDNVFGVSNFIVEYRSIENTDWTIVELGTDNTYSFSGIESCQFFEIRIKSECAITSNESEYSKSKIISGECGSCTLEYCEFTSKNTSDEWINNVSIDGVFNNTTGPDIDGYGNYLGQFDIVLQQGESYELSLSPAFSGQPYQEFFTAAMDFNQDNIFTENEIIFTNESGTSSEVMGTFLVPAAAILGITRFRVVMRYINPGGPCDNFGFEYGEIEDYCVTISEGVDCPSDYTAIVTDSSWTSLRFEIPVDERAEMYLIDYRPLGDEEFISIASDENIIILEDLIECTEYEYKSSVICLGERRPDTALDIIKTTCQTSTKDISKASIILYPNPASNIITINIKDANTEISQVSIRSIDGRLISTKNMLINDKGAVSINISALQSGVYLIDLVIDGERQIEKLIKN